MSSTFKIYRECHRNSCQQVHTTYRKDFKVIISCILFLTLKVGRYRIENEHKQSEYFYTVHA